MVITIYHSGIPAYITDPDDPIYEKIDFYLNSGLNVAMPRMYTIDWYDQYPGPNYRAKLFWYPLESGSSAARALPEGNQFIPWAGGFYTYSGADPIPNEDTLALFQHIRLRGADGYYLYGDAHGAWPTEEAFRADMLDSWKEFDWLFEDVDKQDVQILNTDTEQWD